MKHRTRVMCLTAPPSICSLCQTCFDCGHSYTCALVAAGVFLFVFFLVFLLVALVVFIVHCFCSCCVFFVVLFGSSCSFVFPFFLLVFFLIVLVFRSCFRLTVYVFNVGLGIIWVVLGFLTAGLEFTDGWFRVYALQNLLRVGLRLGFLRVYLWSV